MKTTLELPDELMIEAKTIAAKRKITFRALTEAALRREIQQRTLAESPKSDFIEYSEGQAPHLKKRGVKITSDLVYQMLENEDA
jgi:hypothetical protein